MSGPGACLAGPRGRLAHGQSGPRPATGLPVAAALAAALLMAVHPAARATELPVLAGPAMGTTYRVTLAGEVAALPRSAVHREIETLLAAIDRAASTWREDSDVARVTAAAAGDWIPVADHLVAILEAAREIHDRSGGAFDVTVAGGAAGRPVGMRHVETRRNPPAVRKLVAGIAIDLGGIGPGYAVDAIGARLSALGSGGHLVSLGGEVRAWGEAAPGRPWRVRVAVAASGVATPGDRIIDLAPGEALGTSSVRPGRSPLDPRTGRPVAGPPRSLTALGPTCAAADAWAVAALVLGIEPSPAGIVIVPPSATAPPPPTPNP